MRAYGLAVLLLLCIAGLHCKSSRSSKSGPAGNVMVLLGEATASSSQHGDRNLAIGDAVYRDDRIATFANTTLEIRLLHNGALWSLRGAREVVVGDSPAWRAERASAALLDPNSIVDKTGAAGRHAEREAAEDPSSAVEKEETTAEVFAQPSAGGAPEADPVEADPVMLSPNVDVGDSNGRGYGAKGGGSGAVGDLGRIGNGPAKAKRVRLRLTVENATGAMTNDFVTRIVRARYTKFIGCVQKTRKKGRIALEFSFTKEGTVPSARIELAGDRALLRDVGSCIENSVGSMTAPTQDGETRVNATIEVGDL